jgi:WD40 repeat protein
MIFPAAFVCHENGGTSLLYASQHQLLISAGRKGIVCLWDLRQRTLRHKFTAHDSSVAIKCMALDPNEEFFATGSADGDIKVYKVLINQYGSCNDLYSLKGLEPCYTTFTLRVSC